MTNREKIWFVKLANQIESINGFLRDSVYVKYKSHSKLKPLLLIWDEIVNKIACYKKYYMVSVHIDLLIDQLRLMEIDKSIEMLIVDGLENLIYLYDNVLIVMNDAIRFLKEDE